MADEFAVAVVDVAVSVAGPAELYRYTVAGDCMLSRLTRLRLILRDLRPLIR